MCGITGFILPEDEQSARLRLQRMTDSLRHRGPDDEGQAILPADREGWVTGMGHRRLSILDLTPAGHQPMATPDRVGWIVYNGEIYNFQELRGDLEARGERFTTRCDTEVLVRLLTLDGPSGLSRCNGMWGLAFWDTRDRSLLLARDRIGIKPVYYYHDGGRFVFGSEIKALLAAGVPRRLREASLAEYLTYGYCPDPDTMFEGIHQLEAGHWLRWRNGRITIEPYWQLAPCLGRQEPSTPEALLAQLDDAVDHRMISDVPVGAFLSGGIDSSAIVAGMRATGHAKVRSFCISFPGTPVDESRYARSMARHVRAEHSEHTFEPDGIGILARTIQHVDEPFADDALLPTYMMCQLAREEVAVALSGDGGDEIFAGYDKYRTQKVAQSLPGFSHGLLALGAWGAGVGRRMPLPARLRDKLGWAQRMLDTARLAPEDRYLSKMTVLTPDVMRSLSRAGAFEIPPRVARLLARPDAEDFLARMLYADVHFSLVNNMLRKVDRMSMAWSLEVRVPFLDHRMVEFAASLPSRQRIHGLTGKYLLRQALADRLPTSLLTRPKQGFDVPLDRWFRGQLVTFVRDILSPTALARHGLLNENALATMLSEHEAGRANWSRAVFALVTFQMWHDAYFRDRQYMPPSGEGLPEHDANASNGG